MKITPDNINYTYAYNDNGNLATITTPQGNFAFTYDANNRRTTRTMPNGIISIYSYDNANRLTGIQTTKSGTTIDSLTYTLDNVGNRTNKNQNITSTSYTYDDIYRLTNASPTGTTTPENYTYDAVGNRQTSGHEQFPQTNATTVYSYDDENRLTGVTITQGSNVKQRSFAYDPFGRRIKKTIAQDTIGNDCQGSCPRITNYVYDGQNIIMEYDQNNNIIAKYTHGPNIDEPLAVSQGTNIYYYHADGLGSITALSNTSGTIVQTYPYDSFGNITATGSISQPFTYTAREYDSETGMYFYRARYYDPKVGRFVTKDPIGFEGGDVNLYNYVGANPVNGGDPSGLIDLNTSNAVKHYSTKLSRGIEKTEKYLLKKATGAAIGKVVAGVTGYIISLIGADPLDDPYLGPDGNWYYPDGTPVGDTSNNQDRRCDAK
jgi:RHS repeat-associated protein